MYEITSIFTIITMMEFTGVVSESLAQHCTVQYSLSPWSSSSNMLLQSQSSMSSLSLASHDLSMTKHTSVLYLFAAVQNIRNNLNDTPTMLVMIDTMYKLMMCYDTHKVSSSCANLCISSSY